jgi:predicted ArsR family transcriptional regulator
MRYSLAMSDNASRSLERLAVLAEPIRRRLYEHVVGQAMPVGRDDAAGALNIGRPLAAFHLDRLVEGGLLEVEYHRRSGRTGPGAGRPAKFYRRAAKRNVEVSLPPRRYSLAAEILADGLDRSMDTAAVSNVLDAARAAGDGLASSVAPSAGREALFAVLRENGYEPFEDTEGVVRLRNCPFDALAERHRELTCSMNLALLASVVERLPGAGLTAQARPTDGACCVAFLPSA